MLKLAGLAVKLIAQLILVLIWLVRLAIWRISEHNARRREQLRRQVQSHPRPQSYGYIEPVWQRPWPPADQGTSVDLARATQAYIRHTNDLLRSR